MTNILFLDLVVRVAHQGVLVVGQTVTSGQLEGCITGLSEPFVLRCRHQGCSSLAFFELVYLVLLGDVLAPCHS